MLWIGRGFLVIRPNFGGDIQLYMNGMKGFFLPLPGSAGGLRARELTVGLCW